MQTNSPTLTLDEVAQLLRLSKARFQRIRRSLEEAGFPPKLPALGCRWSTAAVLDWIATQGGTAPAGSFSHPAGASVEDDADLFFEQSRQRLEAAFNWERTS